MGNPKIRFYFKYFVEIETNGTITPIEEMMVLVDQWNVSLNI
jgi:hypothetical protein